MRDARRTITKLEADLNDHGASVRSESLHVLLDLARQGAIELAPETDVANMHCHTCFSFNCYGYSPTALAWLAKRRGFKLIGVVDVDVLDSVDEFLTACDVLGVRGTTALETRLALPEFASCEINAPGEPGVCYHMGVGFVSGQPPEAAAAILTGIRTRSSSRCRSTFTNLSDHLAPLTVDYERDVVALTPRGNVTERHLLAAYTTAAARQFADPLRFWADKLDVEPHELAAAGGDLPGLQALVRRRLMKRGGVGYVDPAPDAFPSVTEFYAFVTQCRALPCAIWLDGESAGEQAVDRLLERFVGEGVVALALIPGVSLNVADPVARDRRRQRLYDVAGLAHARDLPLIAGTEMNTLGQKLVDDFDSPELEPLRDRLLDGAYFLYGHTIAERLLGLGYQSDWAKSQLPTRRERNTFYAELGRAAHPGIDGVRLSQMMAARAAETSRPVRTDVRGREPVDD